MTVTRRFCANCAFFNQMPKIDEPKCRELVTFGNDSNPTLVRQPTAEDLCDQHLTAEEAGIKQLLQASTPAFVDAIEAHFGLLNSPILQYMEVQHSMLKVLELAPSGLREDVERMAEQIGVTADAAFQSALEEQHRKGEAPVLIDPPWMQLMQ